MEKSIYLNKTFKFFDIQNKNAINFDQFKRAVQKIGVVLSNDNALMQIFSHYDKSGDGTLDYRELSRVLEAKAEDKPLEEPRQSEY